jgi:hypothetical protein
MEKLANLTALVINDTLKIHIYLFIIFQRVGNGIIKFLRVTGISHTPLSLA